MEGFLHALNSPRRMNLSRPTTLVSRTSSCRASKVANVQIQRLRRRLGGVIHLYHLRSLPHLDQPIAQIITDAQLVTMANLQRTPLPLILGVTQLPLVIVVSNPLKQQDALSTSMP